jgi:cell wall-associated NlpC family hydrolase
MSRPKNDVIRAHLIDKRNDKGWKQLGAIRYGLCLWASQEILAQYGAYHVSPSAAAFARTHPLHHKPRVGDMLLWYGGSHGYGHAAVYLGHHKMLSTDIFGGGSMRVGPVSAVHNRWGQHFAGAWTPPELTGPLWKDQHHRRR